MAMLGSCLHLLSLLCIFFLKITSSTITNHVAVQRCRPNQTETLSRFIHEFAFSSSCSDDANFFRGVVCDNATGAITVLDLPGECLRGTLRPNSSLFELRHLQYLNLNGNDFISSSLPSAFGQLTNLEVLSLAANGFLGQVPSSIRNLTKLTELNLSDNKLSGNFFPLLRNLTKLSALILRNNQFSGTIPSFFFTMPSLYYLDLRTNHLTGSFEVLKNSSSNLETLRLGYNNFKAEIIDPVLKLVNLKVLTLSSLNISHPVDLTLFFSLKSLLHLNLNGNSLTRMSVNSDTALPKKMEYLLLAGCNISEFPRFLKSLKMLNYLVLSDNKIKGNVPDWLWSLPRLKTLVLSKNYFTGFQGSLDHVLVNSSIHTLDLSSNSFRGSFPSLPLHIMMFSAFNNSFTGNIPLEICNRTSFEILELSYNNLTGSIPPCLSNFKTVNLRKNNLEGKIPDEFYIGVWTETLDVGYNRLSGKLPRSLLNCSLLGFLSVDHNIINDSFPFWLKALPNLKVLTLRSNMFHGPISSADDEGSLPFPKLHIFEISHNRFTGSLPANYFANWSAASLKENDEESMYMGDSREFPFTYHNTLDLQYKGLNMEQAKVLTSLIAIDFSGNKFKGEIPESVGLLNTLIALNLSNNSFTGHIPMSFANLTKLESLDLSRNKLSGKIPQELARLSSLAYIAVSDNQLTGEIPQGTQITGQAKSSFEGNPGLCGLPLEESCIRKNTPSTLVPEKEDEEEILKWRIVAIGYGPGVLFGLAIGHVVALYKPKWFIKNYGQNRFRGIRQL